MARVAEVAETLHITPLLDKPPAHLSGGERQRVAIGRALVRDPAAFLMDEPIAALDARLREEMRVELKRLQRELHHTIVYVTHDQEEAMSIADRIAVMEAGEIRQVGTPAENLQPAEQPLRGRADRRAADELRGRCARGRRPLRGARRAACDHAWRARRGGGLRRSRCGPKTWRSIPPAPAPAAGVEAESTRSSRWGRSPSWT